MDDVLSEVAQKLVKLAVDVLQEAVTTHHATSGDSGGGSDGPTDNSEAFSDGTPGKSCCGQQLAYTARSIFEMFASLTLVYHQNVLSTVPQLAGKNFSRHCHWLDVIAV